jgi:hypothetical protein
MLRMIPGTRLDGSIGNMSFAKVKRNVEGWWPEN